MMEHDRAHRYVMKLSRGEDSPLWVGFLVAGGDPEQFRQAGMYLADHLDPAALDELGVDIWIDLTSVDLDADEIVN